MIPGIEPDPVHPDRRETAEARPPLSEWHAVCEQFDRQADRLESATLDHLEELDEILAQRQQTVDQIADLVKSAEEGTCIPPPEVSHRLEAAMRRCSEPVRRLVLEREMLRDQMRELQQTSWKTAARSEAYTSGEGYWLDVQG